MGGMQELARLGGCHLLILSWYSLQISDWEIVLEISNISHYLNHKDLTCRAENEAGPAEDSVMLNITCEQLRRGWGGGLDRGVWLSNPPSSVSPSSPHDPAARPSHLPAFLVHPLLRGRQPHPQHPLALQRHGPGGGTLHPHPHHGVRAQLHRPPRLPPAQPSHPRQQWQLHPRGAEPAGLGQAQRPGAVHGQPLQLQP